MTRAATGRTRTLLRITSPAPGIPYFSQWESAARAADIIAGDLKVTDDPLWRNSGANSAAEYAEWANHICGMACLKMILAARTGTVHPNMHLTRVAVEFGAYQVRDGEIRGMIYAPMVEMVKNKFAIDAEVVTGIATGDIASILRPGSMFIASVHPSIRWLKGPPPRRGGHLVLVTSASNERVVFHHPAGHSEETPRDGRVPTPLFDEFFAGRGVHVLAPGA